MLNLAEATPPEWSDRVLDAIDVVLVDHAHCEKKAAHTAIKLLFRYPQHRFLQEPLSRLAREELVHFEQVLALIEQRGGRFAPQRPSAYGGRLHRLVRPEDPERLLDWLLVSALIEARSCERFKLLAQAAADREPELARFYTGLLASEARHHQVYVDLASQLASAAAVRERLGELAEHEAAILREPARAPRLHA